MPVAISVLAARVFPARVGRRAEPITNRSQLNRDAA